MIKNNAREKAKVSRTAIIIALSLLLHLCLAALAGAVIDSKREKPEFRQEITLRLTPPPILPPPVQHPDSEMASPIKPPPKPAKPELVKPRPVAAAQAPAPEPTGVQAPPPAPTTEPEPATAPATPNTAFSDSDIESAKNKYGSIVRSRIDRAKSYPTDARRDGLEGRVKLRLTIAADGSPSSVTVSKSSGSEVLDRAAILAAQRAAPFPPLPEELGNEVIIVVSINFNLPR